MIGQNKPLAIISPTPEEVEWLKTVPASLATGEAESIAVCYHRGWIFCSFDRKAINCCRHNNISVLTLNNILAAAWRGNFVSKNEVEELIQTLEAGGRTIKAKDDVLKD